MKRRFVCCHIQFTHFLKIPSEDAMLSGDFGDIDGDGDLDLFIGCYTEDASSPGLYYAENTGSSSAPVFAAPTLNPFDFTPVSTSYDGIALGDLIAGDYYTDVPAGTDIKPELYYYENSKF